MTTRATATVQGVADQWETLYPSAVFSGIVGDTSHAERGGYHISIEDQTDPANYSVVRPDDKAPPGTWPRDCASAIDMNLALADMKTCHARLVAAWRDRATDPRAKYVNAHNGWNGSGNAGRYDWVTGSVGAASDDHKWHVHLEIRRRYVNDAQAARAVLSILRGQSLADYLAELEDDMAFTDAQMKAFPWQYTGGGIPAGMSTLGVLNELVLSARAQKLRDEAILAAVKDQADTTAILARIDAKADELAAEVGQVDDELFAKLSDPATPDEQAAAAVVKLLGARAATVVPLIQRYVA